MSETPREYKKRIEEKWKKNEKNKEELIKKIEGYEILDKGFKEQTRQEILVNFEKNEKAELEGEQYTTIVAELGKIDKKYEELEELKSKLESKREEKFRIEVETRESKIDGSDETTLKLQINGVRKLKDKLKSLQSDIDELENDIKNREQEIKDIEESYGEKIESAEIIDEYPENDNEIEIKINNESAVKPETLKEYHNQTIKELWSKDKTRKDIIKLLESGSGIDNELTEKIKKEIYDRFFVYYEEKQGELKMKSARHLKNKLRNRDKILDELNNMPEGKNKVEGFAELEKMERLYGLKPGEYNISGLTDPETIRSIKTSKSEIKEGQHFDGLTKEYGEIGGKPVVKVKDEKGTYSIFRGNTFCGGDFVKVFDIGEIGGYPIFKAKDKYGYYSVVRGTNRCNYFKSVGEIGNIGGKPVYKAIRDDGYEIVMRGYTPCCHRGIKKVYEIKACEGKPVFIGKKNTYDNIYDAFRGDKICCSSSNKIEIVGNIGGKPVFKMKDGGYYRVLRGNEYCARRIKKILNFQNFCGKPFFVAQDYDGRYTAVRGYEKTDRSYDMIGDNIGREGNEPFFTAEGYGKRYRIQGTQVVDLAKLRREKWNNWVGYINENDKEKIITAAEKIQVSIEMDTDGSNVIVIKLKNKTYKILDPNLENHTDKKYFFGSFSHVYLSGMLGDDVDKWKNKKLKKYVKQKQLEGFHIPNIEEMKDLLQELGKEADISHTNGQIAMLLYLTGLDGVYWLSMGDGELSGSLHTRSKLLCTYGRDRYFKYGYSDDRANLCMIACEENE